MFIIPIKSAFQFLVCLIMSLNAWALIKLDCMELAGCCQQYWFLSLSLPPSLHLFHTFCLSSSVTCLLLSICLYLSIILHLFRCLFFSKPLIWLWPAGCCCPRCPGQELDHCRPSAEMCNLNGVWAQVSLSLYSIMLSYNRWKLPGSDAVPLTSNNISNPVRQKLI